MPRKQLSGQNQNNLPITNVPLPQVGSDVANKTYVDNAVENAGGGASYIFQDGVTENAGNVRLGGNFDQDIQISGDVDHRFDINIKDSNSNVTSGLAISDETAQLVSGNIASGSSNISLYPALAGFQVSSPDEIDTNILIHKPTETQITAYPNSRDDSATDTPENFIYTDIEGNLRSAPTTELGGGGGGVAIQPNAPTDTDVLWIDTDETDVPAPVLTVSAVQPSNPVLNDLWVDIS